jgi:hypothetical protein
MSSAHGLALLWILAAQAPVATPPAAGAGPHRAERAWPRTYAEGGVTLEVHPPQVDAWNDDRLTGRAAAVVRTVGSEEPSYGVFWLAARTEVDKEARLVHLTDISVTRASFPTAPGQAEAWRAVMQRQFPHDATVSLDRLEASLAVAATERSQRGLKVRNDPPAFVFRTRPALLVYVDGDPVFRPAADTGLERVINTRPLLLRDRGTGRLYLRVYDGWLTADGLAAAWSVSATPPAALERALAWAQSQPGIDLLDPQAIEDDQGEAPSLARGPVPEVVVATRPTELVVTDGEPQLSHIEGTGLLFWKNTRAHVFVESAKGRTWILASGRWFSAPGTSGPWSFVGADRLPDDFARIPEDHPQAAILASVAGTPQAQEALIANSIPQTATVRKDAAAFTPAYDGAPKLAPIEGTSLSYVVNSATPVIRVAAESWFACVNGVWFAAPSAAGPFSVAASVPAAIYAIPPSSPLHYVTYVKVYGATQDEVRVGYTPGYMGTCVASEGVVVYGTGYAYPPYVGAVWIGTPVTFGFGWSVGWSVWGGWDFFMAYGVVPWWGPMWIFRPVPVFYPWPVYHPRPAPFPIARPAPYPRRGVPAPIPARPAPRAAPRAAQAPIQRPTRANVYATWGEAVSRPAPAPARRAAPAAPQAPVTAPRPDLYAGPDGRVYRPVPRSGGWEGRARDGWSRAPQPPPTVERERAARAYGGYRAGPQAAPRPAVPQPPPAAARRPPPRAAPPPRDRR